MECFRFGVSIPLQKKSSDRVFGKRYRIRRPRRPVRTVLVEVPPRRIELEQLFEVFDF